MADHTAIEWTDATWNPITGCSVVSPGCTNCYAMRLAGTRLRHHPSRVGLTKDTKAGPVWTGEVRLNEQWLDQPLRWKRPRRIFVCAHGDLFAEGVPDEWIDGVFAVMALAPQHTFQVLTKRADRMRAYVSGERDRRIASRIIDRAINDKPTMARAQKTFEDTWPVVSEGDPEWPDGLRLRRWPLPNIWLGVSAEDQKRADERIPHLLATPAAVRFVSAEPLLGPIDFKELRSRPRDGVVRIHRPLNGQWFDARDIGDRRYLNLPPKERQNGRLAPLDWIIVGGESGAGARPMHPEWVCSIRDQCAAAGTAFFFKQWGKWAAIDQSREADEAGWQGRGNWMILDRNGDLDIPDHRWPDEEDGEVAVIDVGKSRAGRLLDGIEHNAMPRIIS